MSMSGGFSVIILGAQFYFQLGFISLSTCCCKGGYRRGVDLQVKVRFLRHLTLLLLWMSPN